MPNLLLTIVACVLLTQADPAGTNPTQPQRIIANAPSNAEIVCALGAGDRLVGVSSYVTYPDRVRDLPKVGGLDDPDLESILALNPSLILQRGNNAHVAALCARHGIRLYVDRTDSLSTLYATIIDIGELLARQAPARTLAASIRTRLSDIAGQAPKNRPRVLLALRGPDRLTPLTTVGRPSYLHEVIEIAGGTNIFGDVDIAYPEVNLEEVIARQPDIIIDAMPGAALSAEAIERTKAQWSALRTLPAVKNAAIHVLTEDYALTPSPRVVLLAEKLQEIFSGEAPTRAD